MSVKSLKESKTAKSRKSASSKKASAAKAASKKKTTKVVTVSLKGEAKTAPKKRAKRSDSVSSPKTTSRRLEEQKASQTKVTAKRKVVKPTPTRTRVKRVAKTRTSETTSTEINAIPSPTKETLKPFREAAKRTKKLQKERKKKTKVHKNFLAKPGRKGKRYTLDLRIHTPASNGFFSTGGLDPAPALVRLAKVKGLDVVGVTDYYSTRSISDIQSHASSLPVTVIPGFDMKCLIDGQKGIAAISLFPQETSASEIQEVLSKLRVPASAEGSASYVIELPFEEVLSTIEGAGGIVIPSRIDKTPHQHLAIPALVEKFGFHAFDLVHEDNPDFFKEKWPEGEFTFFSFSNANALAQVGERTANVKLASPGFEGLKQLVARRV